MKEKETPRALQYTSTSCLLVASEQSKSMTSRNIIPNTTKENIEYSYSTRQLKHQTYKEEYSEFRYDSKYYYTTMQLILLYCCVLKSKEMR